MFNKIAILKCDTTKMYTISWQFIPLIYICCSFAPMHQAVCTWPSKFRLGASHVKNLASILNFSHSCLSCCIHPSIHAQRIFPVAEIIDNVLLLFGHLQCMASLPATFSSCGAFHSIHCNTITPDYRMTHLVTSFDAHVHNSSVQFLLLYFSYNDID